MSTEERHEEFNGRWHYAVWAYVWSDNNTTAATPIGKVKFCQICGRPKDA